MSDPLKSFIADVERRISKRQVIAAGRMMAKICDKRIERARKAVSVIAGHCEMRAGLNWNPKNNAKAWKRIAAMARKVAETL